MFCSECGTKIKDDAKFCFNCGAKITENSAEAEREVPEEFLFYVEGKLLESYVEGKEPTTDLFYKKAKFYEVEEKQVDEIIREYEAKIAKLETFTDSIYEACTLFELDEEEEEEIYNFGNSLGFDNEEIEELLSCYEESHRIEEKQELYKTCILDYIGDGQIPAEHDKDAEEYQQEVYDLFRKNILQLETLLKQEYEKTTDSELNQEQLEFIYSEAEKWFPEEAMIGILYTYDNKTGLLEIKEEKRKQEALERMTFFELYDVKIGYTEEECRGIAIGKKYRKLFQQLNDDFLELYNSLDRTEDTCWEPLNEKIVYSLAAVYKTLTSSLSQKGVSEEDISTIDHMDVFQYWIPVFEDIDDQYNDICYGAEAAEYYRELRKATRGRLIGGGFGLDGAIKGIATAGAINMAAGAAHSIFNLAGNMRSDRKKIRELRNLFGSSLREKVETVLKASVQWACQTELEMLEDYDVSCKGFQLFYKKSDLANETCAEALQPNPFARRLYENIILSLGIDEGIDQLADFTGIEIEEIKAEWERRELESRTVDGIVFPTVEDKEAYCKEKEIYQPLLDEIKNLNVWVEQQKFAEKVTELRQMEEPSVENWKEERDKVLDWYEKMQKAFQTPNNFYLSQILQVARDSESNQKTIVREGYSNYEALLDYFNSILEFEDDEKIALFLTSPGQKPDEALLFGTKHNYYVNQEQKIQFDFKQLSSIRYETEKALLLNDKITCMELELEDERKIDVTSLFLRRRYSNYAIHEEFVNAIKECIKHIPPKRKPVTPKTANSGSPAKETKKPQEIPNDWKEKYDLAVMYEEGAPEKRNPEAALAIYQELAETGIPLAQWRLARFYKSGTAVEKNIQKAVEWFTKAAEQGNVQAMDALGNIYSSLGKKEWKADNSKSLYWWTQAAQRGNARAQFNLSIYYNTIQQDFSQRLYWLNEAAKNGHDIAQNALGELYLDGDDVKKDYRIAAYWFGQSAKNGYAHGQYSLGICYANGIGVEQSTANARYWFEAAAKQGHKYAAKELKRLR